MDDGPRTGSLHGGFPRSRIRARILGGTVASKRTGRLLAAALCGAMVAAYLVLWLGVGALQIGRSDFTSTYVGATLLREGHGASMYDEALQTPLHASLLAPDR